MSTLLEVKDITKIYPNQPKPGLDHVSFEVMQGEFLGIMGASGSGKTTLLNVLSTIDIPTSGSIRMGGKKIQELSQTQEESRLYLARIFFVGQSDCAGKYCSSLDFAP